MKKKGLFFGTFDPLHNGHVSIAKYFIKKLDLEELWLIVTPLNPFKKTQNISSELNRLEMVKSFCSNQKQIICSSVEFELSKPNYTADTLNYIVNKNPKTKFFVILGEDNLNSLHLWKDFKNILEYPICVYPRKNLKKPSNTLINHKMVRIYDAPVMDISSSLIRNLIKENKSFKDLVPEEIFDKMKKL